MLAGVLGHDHLISTLIHAIESQQHGSILLHGNSGKSLISSKVARHCAGDSHVIIDCSTLVLPDEDAADHVLLRALSSGKCRVVVFDGIDLVAPRNPPHLVARRIASLVLDRLRQLLANSTVTVVATCPSPHALNPRVLSLFSLALPIPNLPDDQCNMLMAKFYGSPDPLCQDSSQLHGMNASSLRRMAITAKLDGAPDAPWNNAFVSSLGPARHASVVGSLRWSDVAGGSETSIASMLKTAVIAPLLDPSRCSSVGLSRSGGVLLHGPSGCGKTLLAMAACGETGLPAFFLRGPDIISPAVGASEKRLSQLFEEARSVAPAVIVIDQAETLAPAPPSSEELTQTQIRLVTCLCAELDACRRLQSSVIVIATVQDIHSCDAGFSNRLPLKLHVPKPDKDQIVRLLKFYLGRMSISPTITDDHLQQVAGDCVGETAATIASLCNEAAMICLRDSLENTCISLEHLLQARDYALR